MDAFKATIEILLNNESKCHNIDDAVKDTIPVKFCVVGLYFVGRDGFMFRFSLVVARESGLVSRTYLQYHPLFPCKWLKIRGLPGVNSDNVNTLAGNQSSRRLEEQEPYYDKRGRRVPP
jgi:hypothetical protein